MLEELWWKSQSCLDGMRYNPMWKMIAPYTDLWHYNSPVVSHNRASRSLFLSGQCSAIHRKGVTGLSLPNYYLPLSYLIIRFVIVWAYLLPFGQQDGQTISLVELEVCFYKLRKKTLWDIKWDLVAKYLAHIALCRHDRGDQSSNNNFLPFVFILQ